MADLDDLPDLVDGADPRFTGSPVNEAFWDDVQAALLGELRGATDPTRTPAQTTDEVIAARGSEASLGARLNVSLNPDGTLIDALTADILAQSWHRNLLGNAEYFLWSAGDAAAPDGWTLSGAGAAVARTGAGLADTTEPEYGLWCTKLTSGGGATALLTQEVIPSALYSRLAGLEQFIDATGAPPTVTLIGRLLCSTGSKAFLDLKAGINSSSSPYHTGNGAWQTIAARLALVDGPTQLLARLAVLSGGVAAYFAPVACYLSPVATPRLYIPGDWRRRTYPLMIAAGITDGASRQAFQAPRPGIVTDVQLWTPAAIAGTDFVIDVNTTDGGGAQTSMFTAGGRPRILIGATKGGARPNGTYARQCFAPSFDTALGAGAVVDVDIDTGGGHSAPVFVAIHTLEPVRPLEGFYDHNTV